ncbi:MAG: peptidoglycan-binding protein [Candidatus Vogelbacteria bacterium]|nr:peptidoglycan-binding protein [Candidatus Vogelbacteria bacterium]
MKISKYVVFGVLALAFVLVPAAATNAQTTNAQTIAELQALISRLQAQLQLLLGQQQQTPTRFVSPTLTGTGEWCYNWTRDLTLGSSGEDVSALQTALSKLGFFESAITGYFDSVTQSAVAAWQVSFGISPAVGYFGPISREKMNSIFGCKSTPTITVVSPNGGESWQIGTKQAVIWSAQNVPANNVVNIGLVSFVPSGQTANYYTLLLNLPPDWRGASWTVGEAYRDAKVPTGSYYMSVCLGDPKTGSETCDRSDSYFKIYDSTTTNKPPSISGVSGPTTLEVGKSGTWSVTASDPENGSLSYSVVWGDEGGTTAGSPTGSIQQTATFTHTYSRAGTYYPTFTVTDNAGQSNSASLSVVVQGETSQESILKVTSPQYLQTVPVGSELNIVWTDSGISSTDQVYHLWANENERPYSYVIGSVIGGKQTSTFVWKAGQYQFGTLEPGTYYIHIEKRDKTGTIGLGRGDSSKFSLAGSVPPPVLPPVPTITSSAPPNGAVVAQDTSADWFKGLGLWMSSGNVPNDFPASVFSVSSTRTDMPISVTNVTWIPPSGTAIFPILSRSLFAGERIRLTHKPSNSSVCLGFLPGDVDQNGWALSSDIGLLNSWLPTAASVGAGASQLLYKTDINRDGVFDARDVTRAGELMSDPNRVYRLPACPAPLGMTTTDQNQLANALSAMSSLLQTLQKSLAR